jgi:hypothetical protein
MVSLCVDLEGLTGLYMQAGAPDLGKSTMRNDLVHMAASPPVSRVDGAPCGIWSSEIRTGDHTVATTSHTWASREVHCLDALRTTVIVKDGPEGLPFTYTFQVSFLWGPCALPFLYSQLCLLMTLHFLFPSVFNDSHAFLVHFSVYIQPCALCSRLFFQ